MARLPISRFTRPGDDAAPDFDISIEGRSAGQATQLFEAIRPLVSSIAFEEDEEMSAQMEMTVINQPDTGPGKPVDWQAVIDSKAFAEGNAIDVFMGYGGVRQFMGRTEIVQWLPSFGPSGPTEFTIKGHDARHRMMRGNQFRVNQANKKKQRKTVYRGMPDEHIVRKIAEKYGFGFDVDPTEVRRRRRAAPATQTKTNADGTVTLEVVARVERGRVVPVNLKNDGKRVSSSVQAQTVFPVRPQPSDMTDWNFLRKLASINRFDLWVDYDMSRNRWIVHFKRRRDVGSAGFLFTYNGRDGSLIEAQPEFSITDQPTDVEVLFFDKKRRQIERTVISDTNKSEDVRFTTATPGNFTAKKEIGPGARVRFTAFGQVIEAFSRKPFRSKKEAENFVQQYLKERERDFITMKARVVGTETLRPRQIHQIEGLGKRLDGFYRFTQTKHIMSPGSIYNTQLVAHKALSQEIARRKATTKTIQRARTQQAG